MQVIHFTEGATDPLEEVASRDARFVRRAVGSGESQLGCLHLGAGGSLPRRSIAQDCALLTVHGSITFIAERTGLRLTISGGMGIVLIQCQQLGALESGLSTPQRISGQRWPGEALPRSTAEP